MLFFDCPRTFAGAASYENKTRFSAESLGRKQKRQ